MTYKKWVFTAISLFVIGLACGLVTPSSAVVEEIASFGELSTILISLPPLLTAILIFAKNASVLLLSFMLSPILCLMPILALTVNGFVLSAVAAMVAEQQTLGFVLAALLPHGIIELPALILGEAAALSFGVTVMLSPFRKEGRSLVLPSFKQNLKYLIVALGLLLPAAIIETFVTPLLLK